MEVRLKLKMVLFERGITQKEVAVGTGLRENVISEMVNNQRKTFNREQVAKVINFLEITDMNEIFEIK
ncbi:helix-turn-helix transcriptional regulator [Lysinibacillus irui]|uniref:Helix-turn-helix transcriptional regulator n=1 Tax=Lysinibacillus irui TaxID=2998077 RepID=A0ABU5NQM7_9BACI|nr:helix-turn-helix transcriptional regulator [Lysinibacillus irui]MEA0556091.1 helix-turn-helix transcriptional regulator [Lysinibacillus irui]MEA0978345.1 helix-turn-helix transcriptional regulator [Lysinibacillus irui]MEA1044499.1 helix-turn-helix transcriptional regulator [Lysinibacillus irui]